MNVDLVSTSELAILLSQSNIAPTFLAPDAACSDWGSFLLFSAINAFESSMHAV